MKKRHLFIGVGGTRTHARPLFFRGSKALPTELRLRHNMFFQHVLITLMIRVTTDLIPSRFLTYN